MQARAAAEGNNMKNKMSFFYVNTIKNHVCYNNLNYIYIYKYIYTQREWAKDGEAEEPV